MAGERIGAGFKFLFYGVVNANGYLIGNTADGPSAGDQDGEPMLRLTGARTIPIQAAEDEVVTVTGDDEPMTTFDFPAGTLPSGVFEQSERDMDFEALVQGTKVQSIGDLNVSPLMPSDASKPDLCYLIQRRAKKWESGSRGASAWEIYFVPKAKTTPLGANVEQRTFSPYRYSFTTSKSDRLPWGATFTEAAHGTTSAPFVVVESDNPVHLHAFQGDNSETVFNLAYTPKAAAKVHVYVDGVKQTVTTDYAVSGNVVTFVAAPADGARILVLYEVDEGDLS